VALPVAAADTCVALLLSGSGLNSGGSSEGVCELVAVAEAVPLAVTEELGDCDAVLVLVAVRVDAADLVPVSDGVPVGRGDTVAVTALVDEELAVELGDGVGVDEAEVRGSRPHDTCTRSNT
jgi:hypothetical protein